MPIKLFQLHEPDSKKALIPVVFIMVLGCIWFVYHIIVRPPLKKVESSPAPSNKAHAYYRNSVAVLMYHNVQPQPAVMGALSIENFDQHLSALQQKGFHFISVDRLAAFLDGKRKVPDNALVLTFDDGYKEIYSNVFPILKKRQIPATVFIIGGVTGKKGSLTWEQAKEMEASKLVTFGGHTYNAHNLVECGMQKPQPTTVARIYDQTTNKQETLEQYIKRMTADSNLEQQIFQSRLGHKSKYYAFPYGAYTPELVKILQASGYRYLFTVVSGINCAAQDKAHILRIDAGKLDTPQQLLSTIRHEALSSKAPHKLAPIPNLPERCE